MIDKSLNYGRHLIKKFLHDVSAFNTVLDIGAGLGNDLLLAREINLQADLYAIECFPEYAGYLKEQAICVEKCNIERDIFPFPDHFFDVVILNQVLEHTKEVFWIFHEISRVLRVGGKIILGVPNLASLHNRFLLLFGYHPSPIKTASAHLRGFTKRDILNFLEECFPGGYVLRKFGGSNFYPFPPVIAKPLAKFFPSKAWGIFLSMSLK